MLKKLLYLTLTSFLFNSAYAQLNSTGHVIKDDIGKSYILDKSSGKRSLQNPTSCQSDTVEYPRYKSTSLVTISVSRGRSLGQLYNCPKPLVLTGFTFYGFIIPNPPTSKKMNLICNVYKAGPDSLPSGAPLRSDTVTIDSTFGGGVLTRIEKKAMWQAITMDSAYILTVETDSATLTAGIVVNNYSNGDGDRENLNSGSISGLWYNGRNLNVNGIPFDCDILLHPYVEYKFGTDFSIKNNCYNINDTIKFNNAAPTNMSGSKMYNRYLIYNLGYICHLWNYDNGMGSQYVVDGKVKYNSKQNAKIQLISTVYGYRGGMQFGCDDTTYKDLFFKPDIPTVSGSTNVCIGDSAILSAQTNDPGVTFEWSVKPNIPPFFTGKTLIRYPITKSDTFYLRAVNDNCISAYRTVILKANAYPNSLTVLNDSVCAGSRANLKATSNIGTIQWFTNPLGGLPFYNGPVYQTQVLNKDTFFYVEANNSGCRMSPRVRVDALVGSNFAPSPPTVSNDTTVCLSAGAAVNLSAVAPIGLSVRWFNNASGGNSISTGSTYQFMPTIREYKTFYVDAFNGVCGSSRIPINITVEDHPIVSDLLRDTVCNGDSAYIACSVPYGSVAWYDASSGGNLLGVGNKLAVLPASTGNYYIQSQSDVCISPFRVPVEVVVNNFPGFTKLWGDTICSKNTALLTAVPNGPGIVKWYDTDTGTVHLGEGLKYTTQVLNGGKKYFARSEYAGCIGPKVEVQPSVKNSPFSGFIFDVLTFQQVRVTPINSTGSSVFWDFGDGFTSTKYSVTHRYENTGIYKIKLRLTSGANGCMDSTTVTIEILPSSIRKIEDMPTVNVYPNPSNGTLFVDLGETAVNARKVSIYDMKGQLVFDKMLVSDNGTLMVNIVDLSPGIYMLYTDSFKPVVFIKE